MTDAVKMAIERIKARFHPHYGIDGASDSKQLASDCQALIAALEQAGEPVNAALLDRAELAWQRFFYPAADCFTGPAADKLPSVDLEVADCLRLVLAAVGRLVVTPEADVPAPLTTLQRLGQEFDAGEAKPVAYRFVHLDYAGRKVSRYGAQPERVNGHDPIETHPLYAHPPQSRVAAEPVGLREAVEHLLHVGEFCRTDDTESALRKVRLSLATPSQPDPQSRGQAFDGEGEGFAIGDPVGKFTGEAIWHGVVVASYLTSKGKRRYVVEVDPQGFQMIAVPSQLRALSSAKRGEKG